MFINMTHRLFEKEEAIKTAQMMQANDPEWEYVPVHPPEGKGYSIIKIYDEDGYFLGNVC